MIQIATIPYQKTYKYSYFSQTFLLKLVLYTLALLLPFFLVFSTNNFYLSHIDSPTQNPTITYDYNYHLIIETSASSYTYSTLYNIQAGKAISLSYMNNPSLLTHTFGVEWSKPVSEKVRKVVMTVFFKFSTGVVKEGFGMAVGQGQGYDIADLTIVGTMSIQNGLNKLQQPPTTNILSSYSYNLPQTTLALEKNYNQYLKSSTNYLTTNMPTNILKIQYKLKAPSIAFYEDSPSILGQLVWSFMQYFPIACVLWFGVRWVLEFLLAEGVVSRGLIHDKF